MILLYSVLIILLIMLIAWHDVYRAKFVESAHNYDFVKDRKSKIIKLGGIVLACLIIWLTTKSLYLALFPLGAWALFFDFFYYLFDGRELSLKYWWKHSEFYYWYLILTGEK